MSTPARPDLPTLWITGVSGFLGWHLSQIAAPNWQIYGTYHRHAVDLGDAGTAEKLDLTRPDAVAAALEARSPAAVIHTAALSKPNDCEQQPELSYAVNVTATEQLAHCCVKAKIPLVFTSSEMVFDGQQPPYTEADPPRPINRYGQHKAEAEQRLLAAHPQAVVCRLPLIFGPPAPAADSFLQGFLARLRSGEPLPLFTDEIRTPVDVYSIARGLLLAIAHPEVRILHLGGSQPLSRYEIGCHLVCIWQLAAQLRPCLQADVPMPAPRPPNLTLDSTRARALGYCPTDVLTALEQVYSATQTDFWVKPP